MCEVAPSTTEMVRGAPGRRPVSRCVENLEQLGAGMSFLPLGYPGTDSFARHGTFYKHHDSIGIVSNAGAAVGGPGDGEFDVVSHRRRIGGCGAIAEGRVALGLGR